MNVATVIYLAEFSGKLSFTSGILAFLTLIAYLVLCALYSCTDKYDDELRKQIKSLMKKGVIPLIAFIIVSVILPSKETVYMMSIVNNEKVQSITTNALDVIDQKIKSIKNKEDSK